MQAFLFLVVVPALAGEFTDDLGVKHTWTQAKPTILMNARHALGMIHFGLGADQLHSVFGAHSPSGSNYGGVYADGNQADHGDHEDAAFDLSLWPSHPTDSEMAILKGAHDLSPGCSTSNFWCTELQWKVFDTEGWPDLIIYGNYDSYAYTDDFLGNATEKGIPIIEMKYSSSPTTEGAPRPARSFIEITHRMDELAIALGVQGYDAEAVAQEKAEFCKAAHEFTEAAKGAADRGVRTLAGYFPYAGENDGVNTDGVTIYGFLYGPPTDQVLLMLEELGMQILHTLGTNVEYNAQMSPTDLRSIAEGTPKWPVDFFLADTRVWLDVSSDKFAEKWPHPAITAGQFAPYPSSGNGVHSYKHGAELLDRITDVYKDAQKLDLTETTCTLVDVISSEDHRSDGLNLTEYACYDPVEYSWCEGWEEVLASAAAAEDTTANPDPVDDASTAAPFAAVGLMLALLAQ